MALVNPNIAMSFRQPEIQAPNALAQYAQMQQIMGGQQTQELNRLQIQEYQRAREEEEGTRNFLRGRKLSDPETLSGLSAFGKTGLAYAKQIQEQESAALNAKNTQSQIDERNFGVQKKKLDFAWNAVGSATTPQAAIAELTKGAKDGVFDMKSATSEIQKLQKITTPEEYRQYRVEQMMKIVDAKDKLAFMLPKNVRQDAGGKILTIQDNPMLPGYGQPIAGMDIAKTATIGERTAQGHLAVAQQTLANQSQGVTYQPDASGNIIALPTKLAPGATPVARPVTGAGGAPVKGKLSAFAEKSAAQKIQMDKDLGFAIKELAEITKDGGLIDQSTGSGIGRLADVGARFVGQANPGDIAIGKIAPVADLTLKMIPRFEGPQSDKDTASYKEAAGQLADPTLPTKIRKEAGKTVLRLMQQRKGQFVTNDMATQGVTPSVAPPAGFTPD